MTDPITDMLNRIRNAQAVLKPEVSVPFSNLKFEIAKILKKEKFIEKAEKKGRKTNESIEITLRYSENENKKEPAISGLKRVSRPGQRVYFKTKKIRKARQGFGIAIISTSRGLMTDREAKKEKLGGEILCEIY